ncbi:MAG: hypothetical protein AAF988_01155 [Pseudomonadota bacterium]
MLANIYLFHSAVAPSYSVKINGVVIKLPNVVDIREMKVSEVLGLLEAGAKLQDKVHHSMLSAAKKSPCQIMDLAEEGELMSLAQLVDKGKIKPDASLLYVEQKLLIGRPLKTVFATNMSGFKVLALGAMQRVREYDSKWPIWKGQRRYKPSDAIRSVLG